MRVLCQCVAFRQLRGLGGAAGVDGTVAVWGRWWAVGVESEERMHASMMSN